MGQVPFYRLKSTPLEKNFQAPSDRKILDPYPSVDMVPPVCRTKILSFDFSKIVSLEFSSESSLMTFLELVEIAVSPVSSVTYDTLYVVETDLVELVAKLFSRHTLNSIRE